MVPAADRANGMESLVSVLAFVAVVLELVGFGGVVAGVWGPRVAAALWTAALGLVVAAQFYERAATRLGRGRQGDVDRV